MDTWRRCLPDSVIHCVCFVVSARHGSVTEQAADVASAATVEESLIEDNPIDKMALRESLLDMN